jgi:hypothetical protein
MLRRPLTPDQSDQRFRAMIEGYLAFKVAAEYLRARGDMVTLVALSHWFNRVTHNTGRDFNQQMLDYVVERMPAQERYELFCLASQKIQALQRVGTLHGRDAYLFVRLLVGRGLSERPISAAIKDLHKSYMGMRRAHRKIGALIGTNDWYRWLRFLYSLYLYSNAHPEVLEPPEEAPPSSA